MRRHRSRRKNKQGKIVIITSICLLLIMTAGYATFSTNLNITAKGNIIKKPYVEMGGLEVQLSTEGDGLYADDYENERYIYRGQSPNNYIRFNDELWRIIAKEPDGSYKIIHRTGIGTMQWDSENNRNNDNNTYCNRQNTYEGLTKYWGCNAWNAVDGNFVNGQYSGTVTSDATLNTYLNNEYFNSLNEDKNYIERHIFYTGPTLGADASIKENYELEKSQSWNGTVGLLNLTDFFKASTNNNCSTVNASRSESAPCKFENGNYLDENKKETWTINAYGTNLTAWQTSGVRTISYYAESLNINGGVSGYFSSSAYLVRPVLFLKSSISLQGTGTIDNPYEIIS